MRLYAQNLLPDVFPTEIQTWECVPDYPKNEWWLGTSVRCSDLKNAVTIHNIGEALWRLGFIIPTTLKLYQDNDCIYLLLKKVKFEELNTKRENKLVINYFDYANIDVNPIFLTLLNFNPTPPQMTTTSSQSSAMRTSSSAVLPSNTGNDDEVHVIEPPIKPPAKKRNTPVGRQKKPEPAPKRSRATPTQTQEQNDLNFALGGMQRLLVDIGLLPRTGHTPRLEVIDTATAMLEFLKCLASSHSRFKEVLINYCRNIKNIRNCDDASVISQQVSEALPSSPSPALTYISIPTLVSTPTSASSSSVTTLSQLGSPALSAYSMFNPPPQSPSVGSATSSSSLSACYSP